MKKILLVDDHEVVRSGIKGLLEDMFKASRIHEAADEEAATAKLKLHTYDLIMMDVKMPKSDILTLVVHITETYPASKILIFSMSAENIYAKRFLKAGARGFLSKESTVEEIRHAITVVLNNKKYISSNLAESLADESISDTNAIPFNKLPRREFEIVCLLLSSYSLGEICEKLKIKPSTASTYKARSFEKLGVKDILELKELATDYNFTVVP